MFGIIFNISKSRWTKGSLLWLLVDNISRMICLLGSVSMPTRVPVWYFVWPQYSRQTRKLLKGEHIPGKHPLLFSFAKWAGLCHLKKTGSCLWLIDNNISLWGVPPPRKHFFVYSWWDIERMAHLEGSNSARHQCMVYFYYMLKWGSSLKPIKQPLEKDMTIDRSFRSSSECTKAPATCKNTQYILQRKMTYTYLLNYELNIFTILSNRHIQS